MLEHDGWHLGATEVPLEVGQVERHHLVPDQLVDDGLGEEHVLCTPIEAAQDRRSLSGSPPSKRAVNPRRSAKRMPAGIFMPPGGANSTQVAHTVGFFLEGR